MKLINKIKPALIMTGIVYLTFLLSDLVWVVLSKEDKITNKIVATLTKKTNTNLPSNIFGKEKKVVKKVYKKIKQTKLSLVLVGIINKKPDSIAIIKLVAGGLEKVYKVGDKINSRTKIKAISSKFVIIDHNGKNEKLTLKFKINKNLSTTIQTIKTADITKPSVTKAVKLSTGTKRKLRSYLADIRTNPASALAVVSVQPNFISGLLNGFKVFPSKEKKIFKEIGFKPGDLIIQINDIQLNSISKAFKIGRELSIKKNFEFTIMRNNNEHHIYLDIN